MTNAPTLPTVVALAATRRSLRPRPDLREPSWMFWERRTLNLHRVVGLLKASRPFASASDLGGDIRGVLSRNFKRSWWRGIAYGVVVDVAAVSLRPDDLKALVDIRENEQGTLQWVILVASDARTALGVHTWMEGYLSPVYRETLESLAAAGYRVTSAKREKDGLMRFLAGAADLEVALHSLGARRVAFPEFREPASTLPSGLLLGLGAGVAPPTVVRGLMPEYPEAAKAARIKGDVVLDIVVLPNGTVGDVDVAESLDSVHGVDRAAIVAVKQWQFTPGTKDGKPVPVRLRLKIAVPAATQKLGPTPVH